MKKIFFTLIAFYLCFNMYGKEPLQKISYETAKEIAWIGEETVNYPIKGVILSFHGLGAPGMKTKSAGEELRWSQNGYLVIYPYYGPWSWMNRQARNQVDCIVDAVFEKFNLPDDTPILTHGGSMGGYSAISMLCMPNGK